VRCLKRLAQMSGIGPLADCQVPGSEPQIAALARTAAAEAATDHNTSFVDRAWNGRF
jgi:hypothetical protein